MRPEPWSHLVCFNSSSRPKSLQPLFCLSHWCWLNVTVPCRTAEPCAPPAEPQSSAMETASSEQYVNSRRTSARIRRNWRKPGPTSYLHQIRHWAGEGAGAGCIFPRIHRDFWGRQRRKRQPHNSLTAATGLLGAEQVQRLPLSCYRGPIPHQTEENRASALLSLTLCLGRRIVPWESSDRHSDAASHYSCYDWPMVQQLVSHPFPSRPTQEKCSSSGEIKPCASRVMWVCHARGRSGSGHSGAGGEAWVHCREGAVPRKEKTGLASWSKERRRVFGPSPAPITIRAAEWAAGPGWDEYSQRSGYYLLSCPLYPCEHQSWLFALLKFPENPWGEEFWLLFWLWLQRSH